MKLPQPYNPVPLVDDPPGRKKLPGIIPVRKLNWWTKQWVIPHQKTGPILKRRDMREHTVTL